MTISLAPDPNAPSVPCVHILAAGEIIATVYYDDGDTSDGSPPRGPAAWLMFRNRNPQMHDALEVAADVSAEELALKTALQQLAADDALQPRGIGMAASYAALPWEVHGSREDAADEIVGGLYSEELPGWLRAAQSNPGHPGSPGNAAHGLGGRAPLPAAVAAPQRTADLTGPPPRAGRVGRAPS